MIDRNSKTKKELSQEELNTVAGGKVSDSLGEAAKAAKEITEGLVSNDNPPAEQQLPAAPEGGEEIRQIFDGGEGETLRNIGEVIDVIT